MIRSGRKSAGGVEEDSGGQLLRLSTCLSEFVPPHQGVSVLTPNDHPNMAATLKKSAPHDTKHRWVNIVFFVTVSREELGPSGTWL